MWKLCWCVLKHNANEVLITGCAAFGTPNEAYDANFVKMTFLVQCLLGLYRQLLVLHMTNLSISLRIVSLAQCQSYDCAHAIEVTLKDVGKNWYLATTKHTQTRAMWIILLVNRSSLYSVAIIGAFHRLEEWHCSIISYGSFVGVGSRRAKISSHYPACRHLITVTS